MNILTRPIITEKSKKDAEAGKFAFEVLPSASKSQIEEAVKQSFNVDVKEVHTLGTHGKTRRFGRTRRIKKLPNRKKAIIKLAPGQTINLFSPQKKGGKKNKN